MENKSKYIVLLGDGMADEPIKELGNKTPLEVANTPNMDSLAKKGIVGMTRTVPKGMSPGSDTANLSVFGYDPQKYYTGRSPLEAINMGIKLGPKDVAFRCNITNRDSGTMESFNANHLETEFSKIIIEELSENIKIDDIEFFPGVSYRNTVVWRNYPYEKIATTTPPHDITDQKTESFLPSGSGNETINKIMDLATDVIKNSKKIQEAKKNLKGNPDSIWLWGGGFAPTIDTLTTRFGITGFTISAVDLIHGIGRAAGLTPLDVKGITGYLDTDYDAKKDALINNIDKVDYIFLHVEAPDETGHEGDVKKKIQAIEDFDLKIVGPVVKAMKKYEDYSILVMPDHPTPIHLKTHTDNPVPFCIYRSRGWDSENQKYFADSYNEKSAEETKLYIEKGYEIINLLLNK